MRIPILLSLSIALVIAGCGTTSPSTDGSSSRQQKKLADFDKIAALIEGGNYRFLVRSASPSGGRTIQISSEYTMEVRDGSYEAYLPYFGRAHQASYGGDGGVEFKGEPENLQLVRNDKKNTISTAFTITGKNDQYTINLELGASGFGTLLVSGQKRQSISYYGLAGELEN
jgi:hypothetical protein